MGISLSRGQFSGGLGGEDKTETGLGEEATPGQLGTSLAGEATLRFPILSLGNWCL